MTPAAEGRFYCIDIALDVGGVPDSRTTLVFKYSNEKEAQGHFPCTIERGNYRRLYPNAYGHATIYIPVLRSTTPVQLRILTDPQGSIVNCANVSISLELRKRMISFDFEDIGSFLGGRTPLTHIEGIVEYGQLRVPIRFYYKTETPILLIHYNGAVDRKAKPSGIVFQRSSWAESFPHPVLFIADPTLLDVDGLSSGWGQTPLSQAYFPEVAAKIAQKVGEAIGAERRIHIGSSAGGFQAASAALLDRPGACAWVNNAQFDWTKSANVKTMEKVVNLLGCDSAADLTKRLPHRASVFELARQTKSKTTIRYVLNSESPIDVARQLPVWKDLSNLPWITASKVVYQDSDAGHNPLSKERWFEELENFIRLTLESSPHSQG